MSKHEIRDATAGDLDAINTVIHDAIMTWNLSERVKRLSLPSYQYNEYDLEHLTIKVFEKTHHVSGVIAWEIINVEITGSLKRALSVHGLYVEPQKHNTGQGTALFNYAEKFASNSLLDGILVKAKIDATGFFEQQGMQLLEVENEKQDYTNRYWKQI